MFLLAKIFFFILQSYLWHNDTAIVEWLEAVVNGEVPSIKQHTESLKRDRITREINRLGRERAERETDRQTDRLTGRQQKREAGRERKKELFTLQKKESSKREKVWMS